MDNMDLVLYQFPAFRIENMDLVPDSFLAFSLEAEILDVQGRISVSVIQSSNIRILYVFPICWLFSWNSLRFIFTCDLYFEVQY